jgi:hypothetical protein
MYGIVQLIKTDWIPINFNPIANFQNNSTYLSKLKTYVQNYFSKFKFALLVLAKKLVPLSNFWVDSTKHMPIQIQITITWTPKFNTQSWRTCWHWTLR